MNILLTNDDGITAPGIWAAACALAGLGQVTLVAPATNYSGYGAALPPTRRLSYSPYRHPENHPAHVQAYSLAGTPATCAYAGLSGALGGGPFDLVVSGINHGANLGRDVFYSGTVGAALTAHLLGVPAIAVSLDVGASGVAHWETAAWALVATVHLWQANPSRMPDAILDSTPAMFNVNVPNLPAAALSGILITSLSSFSCLTRYRFAPAPQHSANILAVNGHENHRPAPEIWSDAWALELGYVSITPFRAIPDLLCVVPWNVPGEVVE
ncbi:MAG: 5'/3'-nucleotidase SurE, partial [Caldilineales bacterium]|nr:5'/3'-nucleotidase SurE [Caldilineales bacterium]